MFALFIISCGIGVITTGVGAYVGGKAIYDAVTSEQEFVKMLTLLGEIVAVAAACGCRSIPAWLPYVKQETSMIVLALYAVCGLVAIGTTATAIGIVVKESLSDDQGGNMLILGTILAVSSLAVFVGAGIGAYISGEFEDVPAEFEEFYDGVEDLIEDIVK